ncbi:unnamed protein product [Triticum turgidum subsp. durum]|uniref:GDSL esterase/lipase n=1 Tax=Triticum turgidum subsp. durum TaxID=4567 RepID=A0A9R1ACX9_TRITD|nr:unnamed protein product [Triticum turgidum subsp. durum]
MARSIALVCFLVVGLCLVGAVCASTVVAGGKNGGRLVNAVYVFGRFTNGYNLADVISQRVGFEMSPKPYLSMLPHDKILLGLCKIGANYASGGSGILDTTGKGTLTMRTQVEYFKKAADNMICYPSKEEHLARSLFLLSGGGNDFSAFDPSTARPQAYVVKMVTTYIEHIQALYNMGARMVGILDVPPIGCTPGQRAGMPNGECNEQANSLAQAFNGLLRAKLAEASATTMKELKYSIAANYNILNDMMDNSLVAGLRQVKTACCGSGKLNAEVMCSHRGTTACPAAEHDDYMFWDMLHPTHATIQRGVVALFYGNGPKYGEPVNFGTLVTGQNVSPAIKMVVDSQ